MVTWKILFFFFLSPPHGWKLIYHGHSYRALKFDGFITLDKYSFWLELWPCKGRMIVNSSCIPIQDGVRCLWMVQIQHSRAPLRGLYLGGVSLDNFPLWKIKRDQVSISQRKSQVWTNWIHANHKGVKEWKFNRWIRYKPMKLAKANDTREAKHQLQASNAEYQPL